MGIVHAVCDTGQDVQRVMARVVGVSGFLLWAAFATATPTISFPINSQVPPVVRVSMPYAFTFSPSTFSSSLPLTYSLSNAPDWLSLDASTRTLSGTAPESAINTAPIVQITASDRSGSITMNTTLVVTGNPPPVVVIPLQDQLEKLGSFSPPSSFLYYPSSLFKFSFDPDTFDPENLSYYAVTQDNTPLPSWITFHESSLSFSGETPDSLSLVQPPQVFILQLIASDVLGFAGTAIKFNIVVGNHKLVFKDDFLTLNTMVGSAIEFRGLSDSLELDGKAPAVAEIASITAVTPDWLVFDNSTFALTGTSPENARSYNVSITVVDIYGDSASTMVFVRISTSIFIGTLQSFNVTTGEKFSKDFSSFFPNTSEVVASIETSPSAPWLSFNNQTRVFGGDVPANIQPLKILVTLRAASEPLLRFDSQTFTLNVVAAPYRASTSLISTTTNSAAASSTNAGILGTSSSNRLGKGEIVAIVVPLVLAFLGTILILVCCYRRRLLLNSRRDGTPDKREISNPIPTPSQSDDDLESRDRVDSAHTCTNTIHSSKRHTLAFERYSQAIALASGAVSMNLRDSNSSGTRGRSYSESAISDFGSGWGRAQETAYPQLTSRAGRKSTRRTPNARNPQNYAGKASEPFLQSTDRSSRRILVSTHRRSTSKRSSSSIQQTPEFAYYSVKIRSKRTSQREVPNYLGLPSFGRQLSEPGHGSRNSVSGLTVLSYERPGSGMDLGMNKQNRSLRSQGIVREEDSWQTIWSSDAKEERQSALSALTESTEVLNSPRKMTIRQVPKSPSQRLSLNTDYSRAGSRRAVGESPFFAGSSRIGSRGTSRKSPKPARERFVYSISPPTRLESSSDVTEISIVDGLRNIEPTSSDSTNDEVADPLGITYGNVNGGARQLRLYMSQLGSRMSMTIRNSLQFSDGESRFSPEDFSPRSQQHYTLRDQEGNPGSEFSAYRFSPRSNGSPASFNRDGYGVDESPQIAQAIDARAIIRPRPLSPSQGKTTAEGRVSVLCPCQERHLSRPGRPTSSYSSTAVRTKSLAVSFYDAAPDEEADMSFGSASGAFL